MPKRKRGSEPAIAPAPPVPALASPEVSDHDDPRLQVVYQLADGSREWRKTLSRSQGLEKVLPRVAKHFRLPSDRSTRLRLAQVRDNGRETEIEDDFDFQAVKARAFASDPSTPLVVKVYLPAGPSSGPLRPTTTGPSAVPVHPTPAGPSWLLAHPTGAPWMPSDPSSLDIVRDEAPRSSKEDKRARKEERRRRREAEQQLSDAGKGKGKETWREGSIAGLAVTSAPSEPTKPPDRPEAHEAAKAAKRKKDKGKGRARDAEDPTIAPTGNALDSEHRVSLQDLAGASSAVPPDSVAPITNASSTPNVALPQSAKKRRKKEEAAIAIIPARLISGPTLVSPPADPFLGAPSATAKLSSAGKKRTSIESVAFGPHAPMVQHAQMILPTGDPAPPKAAAALSSPAATPLSTAMPSATATPLPTVAPTMRKGTETGEKRRRPRKKPEMDPLNAEDEASTGSPAPARINGSKRPRSTSPGPFAEHSANSPNVTNLSIQTSRSETSKLPQPPAAASEPRRRRKKKASSTPTPDEVPSTHPSPTQPSMPSRLSMLAKYKPTTPSPLSRTEPSILRQNQPSRIRDLASTQTAAPVNAVPLAAAAAKAPAQVTTRIPLAGLPLTLASQPEEDSARPHTASTAPGRASPAAASSFTSSAALPASTPPPSSPPRDVSSSSPMPPSTPPRSSKLSRTVIPLSDPYDLYERPADPDPAQLGYSSSSFASPRLPKEERKKARGSKKSKSGLREQGYGSAVDRNTVKHQQAVAPSDSAEGLLVLDGPSQIANPQSGPTFSQDSVSVAPSIMDAADLPAAERFQSDSPGKPVGVRSTPLQEVSAGLKRSSKPRKPKSRMSATEAPAAHEASSVAIVPLELTPEAPPVPSEATPTPQSRAEIVAAIAQRMLASLKAQASAGTSTVGEEKAGKKRTEKILKKNAKKDDEAVPAVTLAATADTGPDGEAPEVENAIVPSPSTANEGEEKAGKRRTRKAATNHAAAAPAVEITDAANTSRNNDMNGVDNDIDNGVVQVAGDHEPVPTGEDDERSPSVEETIRQPDDIAREVVDANELASGSTEVNDRLSAGPTILMPPIQENDEAEEVVIPAPDAPFIENDIESEEARANSQAAPESPTEDRRPRAPTPIEVGNLAELDPAPFEDPTLGPEAADKRSTSDVDSHEEDAFSTPNTSPPSSIAEQGVDIYRPLPAQSPLRSPATVALSPPRKHVPTLKEMRGRPSTTPCVVCLQSPSHLQGDCPIVKAGPAALQKALATRRAMPAGRDRKLSIEAIKTWQTRLEGIARRVRGEEPEISGKPIVYEPALASKATMPFSKAASEAGTSGDSTMKPIEVERELSHVAEVSKTVDSSPDRDPFEGPIRKSSAPVAPADHVPPIYRLALERQRKQGSISGMSASTAVIEHGSDDSDGSDSSGSESESGSASDSGLDGEVFEEGVSEEVNAEDDFGDSISNGGSETSSQKAGSDAGRSVEVRSRGASGGQVIARVVVRQDSKGLPTTEGGPQSSETRHMASATSSAQSSIGEGIVEDTEVGLDIDDSDVVSGVVGSASPSVLISDPLDSDASASETNSPVSSLGNAASVASDEGPDDLLRRIMSQPLSHKDQQKARESAARMQDVTLAEPDSESRSDADGDAATSAELNPQDGPIRMKSDHGSSIGDFEDGRAGTEPISAERSDDDEILPPASIAQPPPLQHEAIESFGDAEAARATELPQTQTSTKLSNASSESRRTSRSFRDLDLLAGPSPDIDGLAGSKALEEARYEEGEPEREAFARPEDAGEAAEEDQLILPTKRERGRPPKVISTSQPSGAKISFQVSSQDAQIGVQSQPEASGPRRRGRPSKLDLSDHEHHPGTQTERGASAKSSEIGANVLPLRSPSVRMTRSASRELSSSIASAPMKQGMPNGFEANGHGNVEPPTTRPSRRSHRCASLPSSQIDELDSSQPTSALPRNPSPVLEEAENAEFVNELPPSTPPMLAPAPLPRVTRASSRTSSNGPVSPVQLRRAIRRTSTPSEGPPSPVQTRRTSRKSVTPSEQALSPTQPTLLSFQPRSASRGRKVSGSPLFLEPSQYPATQMYSAFPSSTAPTQDSLRSERQLRQTQSKGSRQSMRATSPIAEEAESDEDATADEYRPNGHLPNGDDDDHDHQFAGSASGSERSGSEQPDESDSDNGLPLFSPAMPIARRTPASQPTITLPTLSSLSQAVLRSGESAFSRAAGLAFSSQPNPSSSAAGRKMNGTIKGAIMPSANGDETGSEEDSGSESSDEDVTGSQALRGRYAGSGRKKRETPKGQVRGW